MSILFKVIRDVVSPPATTAAGHGAEAPMRVFIGYDHRQPVAYNVLQHSIYTRATRPLAITPLVLGTLPITRQGLTPFTFSRFLVPWLSDFDGFALFLDLDMLVRGDIAELFELADERHAVQVVKNVERFEWASAILFNCAHPANAVLTPDFVEDADRCRVPHHLDWLDESLVGDLPAEWNHTVGYDTPRTDAKLVHYTQGVPHHPEVTGCEYHAEWLAERDAMCGSWGWTELMGNSVHAKTTGDGRRMPKLYDEGQAAELDGGAAERGAATERYRALVELYRDMHQRGDTLNDIPADKTFDGRSLVAHLGTIADIAREFGARTMLDYGCGKAGAYGKAVALPDGTTVDSVKALWGVDDIRLYDPGYEPYAELPTGTFDGVISTDVLEHCPESDIAWIVDEMFGFADKFLYLTISCRPAVKQLPTGENAHITVHPPQWWREVLTRAAHKHPHVRYFATCYGHGDQAVMLRG